MTSSPWGALLALHAVAWLPLAAEQPDFERAFELERRGSFAAAAEAYRQLLGQQPADASLLLGLERVLTELGRAAELAGPASAASAAAMAIRSSMPWPCGPGPRQV